MRRIPVDYLQEGMQIARDVYDDDGHILLGRDVVLKESYIRRLRNFNICSIYIEDEFTEGVEVNDVISEKTRYEAIRKVKDMFSDIRNQVTGGKNLIIQDNKMTGIVENIVNDLLSSKELIVNLVDIRTQDSYTFAHSVNVAVLAAITGISLNLSANQLKTLTLGALLHDIGKVYIPEEILKKPDKLTPEEYEAIQNHSQLGYDVLKQQKEMNIFCARIAYEHHERLNGTGYPRGLKDNEIHTFSQIVGIVDIYDALTSDRVYHNKILPHEAYEYLAALGGTFFDFDLIKVFLKHIACYPVGTFVQLSTGEVGIVIDTPLALTARPVVKVFCKNNLWVKDPYNVELLRNRSIVVTKVFSEGEIQAIFRGYDIYRNMVNNL